MSSSNINKARAWWPTLVITLAASCAWIAATGERPAPASPDAQQASIVVFGFNNLGMHCMNEYFDYLCILPPYNTLHAQVLLRGEEPQILTEGVTVSYIVPNNTVSSTKTNFWGYAQQLFGVALPPDIGLTGNGMFGTMVAGGNLDWVVTGVPITPLNDQLLLQPYNLANIQASYLGMTANTVAVMPVSWEISCNLCHAARPKKAAPDPTIFDRRLVEMDILKKHDTIHGTNLQNERPVLCAKCHADPALGSGGVSGVPTMSSAMHMSHATRLEKLPIANKCYACHPGVKTQCLRDVHYSWGVTCINCHGTMADVGNPARKPWADEPRCGSCHAVAGHEYEQAGKLFQESHGHGGVLCASCHNSPHAVTPTTNPEDNQQAILHQGYTGVINKCTVCHTSQPAEPFFHKVSG